MAIESQRQCLEPLKKLEGVEGRHRGAGVAELNRSSPDDKRPLRKIPSEDDVVEGALGLVERRESADAFSDQGNVPPSTIAPPSVVPCATDELSERVNDYVRTVMERLQHHRRRHCVIDDQRNARSMRDIGDGLEINDVAGGVADRTRRKRNRFCVVNQCSDRFGLIVRGKTRFDS